MTQRAYLTSQDMSAAVERIHKALDRELAALKEGPDRPHRVSMAYAGAVGALSGLVLGLTPVTFVVRRCQHCGETFGADWWIGEDAHPEAYVTTHGICDRCARRSDDEAA